MRTPFLVLLLSYLLVAAAGPTSVIAEEGRSDCAVCHEDVVTAFGKTGHAVAPGWDPATGCQSCHGPGDAHIEAGGDAEAIVRPLLLPRGESSDGCLSCHQHRETHFSGKRSLHRLEDVGCLDCHNPHLSTPNMLREKGAGQCAGCHAAVAAQFDLPRAHPMGEGGPGCVSCHNPHATRSFRGNPADTYRTCESCHFEKVGPFVYDHGSLSVGGCGSCHEVHGGLNRHLLRHETQINLCYECHTAAQTPGWHSAAQYANRKCTACHTAIHGSNTSQIFLEE